ncbi:MAG: diacylglycerol kinase family lipid kinase [Deltaproteobacteria bacterium]|nr:diacylglycerol kinase family lipid kinase [Deltaproteobacteria bacterium]
MRHRTHFERVTDLFENPVLIVNPRSNQGRIHVDDAKLVPALKATWPHLKVFKTQAVGHATELTLQQVDQNASVIIVLGGDGTLNEVVNGLGEQSVVPLAVLPRGSGNDTARSLGWPADANALIRRLLSAQVKHLDLGLVTSKTRKRYFLNVASCGISAVIAQGIREQEHKISPTWGYYFETLKAIVRYKPKQIKVKIDGKPLSYPNCSLLAFANGQYFGGGMHIAPRAQMDDGRFDEIVVSKMGLLFFLRHGLKVYRGKHLGLPQVYRMRGRTAFVESTSQTPVLIEADGEDAGELPARFEILPRCFPVLI